MYNTFVKDPTIQNKTRYSKMRKFVDKHIKLAKNKYYHDYFEQYKFDSRKQWQMLNTILTLASSQRGQLSPRDFD